MWPSCTQILTPTPSLLGVQDGASDLNMVTWDGSAWGTVTELDAATGHTYRENFTYVWYRDAPVITNLDGETLSYSEDSAATPIDQGGNASVVLGSGLNYDGGNLTVSFTSGSTSAEDVLGIRNQGSGAGQIGLSGANVTYGGTVIGTYSGGSLGSNLVITLNANATDVAVSALISNITYANANTSTPSTTDRNVRFVVTNPLGHASANCDVTVTVTAVNDAPVNSIPGAQSTNEDTPRVFSVGNGNLISIVRCGCGQCQRAGQPECEQRHLEPVWHHRSVVLGRAMAPAMRAWCSAARSVPSTRLWQD